MYEQFITQLESVCSRKGVELEELGRVHKRKRYPLYAAVLNPDSDNQRTACFTAGIHGNEVAGPWACLRFIEESDDCPDVRVLMLPVVNPSGFDRGNRRNHRNLDLNRHFFDTPLVRENELTLSRMMQEDIYFFVAMHEDPRERSFYLYSYGNTDRTESNTSVKIYNRMIDTAAKHFPIKSSRAICNDAAKGGIVMNIKDKSLEHRVFEDLGVPYVAVTETPGKEALSERIDCQVSVMKLVAQYCAK
jgi:hypothetical protein